MMMEAMEMAKRSNGDGSIFQEHGANCPAPELVVNAAGKTSKVRPAHKCDGRWVGTIVVGYRDGKPIRRKVTATTKAKAAARLREMRDKQANGQLTTTRPPTVEEWVTYWLDNIAAKRCKPSTLRGYRTSVSQYIVPLLGHHRLDRLTPEHVEQAWDELQEVGNPLKAKTATATPLAGATALQAHRILSRSLKVAVQRGRATRNVCTFLDAPSKGEGGEVNAMAPDEASRVLAFSADLRNAARWSVALSLGLRQGEALGLTWADVDLDAGTVSVRHALARIAGARKGVEGAGLVLASPKSKSAKRTLVMPAPLLAQMRAHKAAQNAERLAAGSAWDDSLDLVFCQPNGKPIDPRSDWQAWRDLLEAAGVQHYRLHDARHTAATLMLLQGVSTRVAMDVLGHSQISVTMKYQHVVDEMLHDVAKRMGTALWGDGAAAQ